MLTFEQVINSLAPHRCLSCLAEGSLLCDPCSASVTLPPGCCFKCGGRSAQYVCTGCRSTAHIDGLTIAASYHGVAKKLVHRLKFERARAAAEPIARLLAVRIQQAGSQTLCVTPIPTAAQRVRQRGYDQAALIAKELSRLTRLPYCPLLARTTKTRQVGQSRKARQAQLQGAFRLHGMLPPASCAVLLVDDVITTGSTLEAAAALLHDAGVSRIQAAFFAAA
jgi:ComF family protein